jgi:hypothetical protein
VSFPNGRSVAFGFPSLIPSAQTNCPTSIARTALRFRAAATFIRTVVILAPLAAIAASGIAASGSLPPQLKLAIIAALSRVFANP